MNKNLNSYEKKKLKRSQIGVAVNLIIVILSAVLISAFQTSDEIAKWLGVFIAIMMLPALYFSWNILKIAYKDQKDIPNPPLWVPKVYGFGISINPYNRFGKWIMLLITIFIIGLSISIALTPAHLINH